MVNKNNRRREKTITQESNPGRVGQSHKHAAIMKKRTEDILRNTEQSAVQSTVQFIEQSTVQPTVVFSTVYGTVYSTVK